MKLFDEKDFRHPQDFSFMNRLWENSVAKGVKEYIADNGIEEIYAYFDKSSCIEISREMASGIYDLLSRACDMFGLTNIPPLFVKRDYDMAVEIHGFDTPYIVISSLFLDKLSEEMLFGALASRVAGIKAGHHRTLFILWAANIFAQIVPGFSLLAGAASNQWMRTRFYTYDRAFLLATQDIELTLQSILINTLSLHELRQMKCGTKEDLYIGQMLGFNSANSIPKAYYYLFDSQDWAPARYAEIQNYYAGGGGRHA